MGSFSPPPGYARVKVVTSFHELVSTPFADGINGLCWARNLPGDMGEVVRWLDAGPEITPVDESVLRKLALSDAGNAAIPFLLQDLRLLRELCQEPLLQCVKEYARGEGPVPTDVYSFHVDSAPIKADTYLCTYHGTPSEGLRNDESVRCVDVSQTRAELLKDFGGRDDDAFSEYMREGCYDLHYVPLPQARVFSFGVGNLWRVAVKYPGSPVPPFIHRAPKTLPGMPRLLLIS